MGTNLLDASLLNTVHCMDCLEFTEKLPDNCLDLCIIDPPYNVEYKYNDYTDNMLHTEYMKRQIDLLEEIECKLKYGGSLFYITYPELGAEVYTYFKYHNISMTPCKIATRVYNTNLGGRYLRKASRMVLRLSKGEPYKNEIKGTYKNPDDSRIKQRIQNGEQPKELDWFYIDQVKNVSKKHNHPCEIPQELLDKIICGTTNEGDVVYDCFGGSGSTGISAKKNGRNYILVERDSKYVEIIHKRLQNTTVSLFHS